MKRTSVLQVAAAIGFLFLLPVAVWSQVTNASLSGVVTDPTGAVVPNVSMRLRAIETGATTTFTAGGDGNYAFPNLLPGIYELRASAPGFRDYVQSGIKLSIMEAGHLDVKLELGTAVQTVEISASASPLNFENAVQEGGVTPDTLQRLPLVLGQINRNIASFVVLLPGVTTSGGDNRSGFDTRINGGQLEQDEAILDGITMQEGLDSADGLLVTTADHPMTPEMVSEFKEITSNYQPQYGTTTSGVLVAVTKSGTNQFHGSLFEYLRNTALDARSWHDVDRSVNKQNDFGGNIGGPLNFIPGLRRLTWNGRKKTFFFVNYEGYRSTGGTQANILTVPTMQERQGDFSDWKDTSGNLIPVYDPNTTRPNPNYNSGQAVGPNNLPYLRDQFMGCNGTTPNVICPTDPRLTNSLAPKWLQFVPKPTYNQILNNYNSPTPVSQFAARDSTLIDVRVDHYVGDKDHFAVTVHYFGSYGGLRTLFPLQIDNQGYREPNDGFYDRFNYDHTFRPNLLNNFNLGWNDFHSFWHSNDHSFASVMPQIPGVMDHLDPPVLNFDHYTNYGANVWGGDVRPTYVANDMMSWVKGKHTFKFGGEWRGQGLNNWGYPNHSGTFNFSDLNTGLLGIQSGNAMASFLLGGVSVGSSQLTTVTHVYARAKYYGLHFGDTFKATRKLTIDYGLRWDLDMPPHERYDNYSFLDWNGANSTAGNRPGRLVFSGTKWGVASAGRQYPESIDYKGFGPRLGIAYAATDKTVVRAGYAIVRAKLFYGGYSGGVVSGQDGFNKNVVFSSTDGGITPAFLLQNGLPTNYQQPPYINTGVDNGTGVSYNSTRDPTSGRLPYSMMWNLTVSHQFTPNSYVDVAYVANKGTHLLSRLAAANTLNPSLLSMGSKLYDQFTPGQTSLDGVQIPYAGWVEQMTSCPASVAQALLPFPQYCGSLQSENEQTGSSNYQSLQVKAERRFNRGLWFMASYTNEKWITNTQDVQGWGAKAVSPFTRQRMKSIALSDIPQTLSVAFTYEIPFGRGQRFLNTGGVVNKALGGWQVSSIFRINSGGPLPIYSSLCNVPGQFGAACFPGVIPGANPLAQTGGFNPNKPLFNKAAFESPAGFNFYTGQGDPIGHLRTRAYRNNDITLEKTTALTERLQFKFYAQFFNAWNWHCFTAGTIIGPGSPFYTDVNSPNFGDITGVTTFPRNIQFGARFMF